MPQLSATMVDAFSRGQSGGFLVEAEYVSWRIAEPRRDLGRVRAFLHGIAWMQRKAILIS